MIKTGRWNWKTILSADSKKMLKNIVLEIGKITISFFYFIGDLMIMSTRAIIAVKKIPTYTEQLIKNFGYIGRDSLPLLVTSSVFMGLVVGLQVGMGAGPFTPPWVMGGIIIKLVFLEMGPIIFGLLLANRVSAGISSEIGEMNVTEQIDALRTSAIDPIEYIVMPRLLASVLAVPILIVWGDLISLIFAFISTYFTEGLTWTGFVKGMRGGFAPTDMYTSIIKGVVFGIIIALIGCYFGLQAKHGAKGVGKATTFAVIWSSIILIIMDYLISAILSFIW